MNSPEIHLSLVIGGNCPGVPKSCVFRMSEGQLVMEGHCVQARRIKVARCEGSPQGHAGLEAIGRQELWSR